MAKKVFVSAGAAGVYMQPGRTLTERDDGTLHGSVLFKGRREFEPVFPQKFAPHPDNANAFMFEREVTMLPLGQMSVLGHYMGLAYDPTPKLVSYPGGAGRDPIETHPNFKDFATEANGATFDPVTSEWVGFTDKDVPEFHGVSSYYVGNPMVNLTYWTFRRPNTRQQMEIVSWPSQVVKPDGVKNALRIGLPYREVGELLYQVTEQFLGSGPNGWSTTIYD